MTVAFCCITGVASSLVLNGIGQTDVALISIVFRR